MIPINLVFFLYLCLKLHCFSARRHAATRKMKQMKNNGKDTEDLDMEEDNNDMYNEMGTKIPY